jgi:lipooligosaccharide transport system permease protein
MAVMPNSAVASPGVGRLSLRPAFSVVEARARSARRTISSAIVSALLNPLLYLLAMGYGIGAVVDPGAAAALPGGSYIAFLAPGLLVATAMQISASESLWPVMVGLEWNRTYDGIAATPLRPVDITLGHIGFVLVRVALAATLVGAVIVLVGAAPAVGVAGAVAVAVLIAWAFAPPVMAFTAAVRSHAAMTALMRFGVIPLFLFSGTFFPIDRLPAAFRAVAPVSPLWHGAELARAAAVGAETAWHPVAHLALLLLLGVAGTVLAERALRKVLNR